VKAIVPIRVTTCKRIVDHPPVLAIVDVIVGKPPILLLSGVRLIQDSPDQSPRLQGPQIAWREPDDTRRYASPCRIYKPLRKAIIEAVVARLQREGVAL